MDKRLSVTKSNALVEASYRLSLNELRVILYGISLINPMKDDFPEEMKIDIGRFSAFFGIEAHNRGFYNEVKEAVLEKLWNREIGYSDPERGSVSKERWVTHVTYCDNESAIELSFNPRIKSLLQKIQGNFTQYYLEEIGAMKSIYSVRLFEICIMELSRSKKEKKNFTISVEELRLRFMLENKYMRFSNFKSRVLEPARKEISKHSSIKITYEPIKRGKTVREIEFSVARKPESKETKGPTSKYLSKEEIEKNALPGESWDAARKRLERKNNDQNRCPSTIDIFELEK